MDTQQKIKYSLTQNHPLVKLFNWMRDRGLVQFASYEDYIARRNDPAPKEKTNLAAIETQCKADVAAARTNSRCHWCGKFIGRKGQQSGGHDKNWYCKECYQKGLEMEYEAMGLYDKNY